MRTASTPAGAAGSCRSTPMLQPAGGARHAAERHARRRPRRQRSLSLMSAAACRRPAAARSGLSLWRPGADVDWLSADASEPALTLPAVAAVADRPGASRPSLSLGARPSPVSRPGRARAGPAGHRHHHAPRPRAPRSSANAALIGQQEDARDGGVGRAPRLYGVDSGAAVRRVDFKRQADEPAVALCGLDNARGTPRARSGRVRPRRRGGLGPRPSRLPHHAPSHCCRRAAGGGNLEGSRRRRKGRGPAGLCQAGRRGASSIDAA